jgi:hypothetical protein
VNKLLIGVASVALMVAPAAASAHPNGGNNGGWNQRSDNGRGFQGGNRGGYNRGDDGRGGAAVAAGLFGLFLATAIASSSHNAYDQPYGYAQGCHWENRAYDVGYGRVAYHQVEVCG